MKSVPRDATPGIRRNGLLLILLVSVVLRAGTALLLGDQVVNLPGTNDQLSYHNLALRVLGGHGFTFAEGWWPHTPAGEPTAHWSYLYTYFLVAVYAVFGPHALAARLLQAVIVGVLQPYLAYLISKRVLPVIESTDTAANHTRVLQIVPLLAAAITAIYGYFIYYAGTLMTEPFYITSVMAVLYLATLLADRLSSEVSLPAASRHLGPQYFLVAVGLGLATTAAVLLRQLVLLLVPLLWLWLALSARRERAWRPLMQALAVTIVILALAITPFTLFNYARFGEFVLLNTNAGFAFFWGNHPVYGTTFVPYLPDIGIGYGELIPADVRRLNEAAMDKALLKLGVQYVLGDPIRYLLLSLNRAIAYFRFWPEPRSGLLSNLTRVGSFGLFLPFMLYGTGLALWREQKDAQARPHRTGSALERALSALATPRALVLVFGLVYTAIHMLTWTLVRYRLPVDAVFVVFAAYGIADLIGRVRPALVRRKPTLAR